MGRALADLRLAMSILWLPPTYSRLFVRAMGGWPWLYYFAGMTVVVADDAPNIEVRKR